MGRCVNFNCNQDTELGLEICPSCFEKIALRALENFGASERLICFECEREFKSEYFADHLPCEGD